LAGASWQASGSTAAVTALAFTADGGMLAAATADGRLAVIDVQSDRLVVAFRAYYGALLCCCWSADARYLLSGGEDDLVTVWSVKRRGVVWRGEGHRSWVHSLAFDPAAQPSEETRSYRFVSAGADTQLLSWEFREDADLKLPEHPKQGAGDVPVVPAPPYRSAPLLKPQSCARIHLYPLGAVLMGRRVMLTSCVSGVVRAWSRPVDQHKC